MRTMIIEFYNSVLSKINNKIDDVIRKYHVFNTSTLSYKYIDTNHNSSNIYNLLDYPVIDMSNIAIVDGVIYPNYGNIISNDDIIRKSTYIIEDDNYYISTNRKKYTVINDGNRTVIIAKKTPYIDMSEIIISTNNESQSYLLFDVNNKIDNIITKNVFIEQDENVKVTLDRKKTYTNLYFTV